MQPDPEDPLAYCWACSTLILVPLTDDSKPAELFKCGWCGAINSLQEQQLLHPVQQWPPQQAGPQHHHDQHQALQQPSWHLQPHASTSSGGKQHAGQCWQRCWAGLCKACRCLIVAFVFFLISSIAVFGIITLLPRLCSSWSTYLPNLAWALVLVFQIVFNYTAAVMQPAGRVSDCTPLPARGPGGHVEQGSFSYWSWCRHCAGPKPPHTHHCRSCGMCVVDMDHHCPFINNCVGQGNIRPFLLFLMWTLLAACYILSMCTLLVWQQWDVVKTSLAAGRRASSSDSGSSWPSAAEQQMSTGSSSSSSSIAGNVSISSSVGFGPQPVSHDFWFIASTGIFFLMLQASPWWLLAAYYLVAVSLGVLLAVGMLLGSQLYYLGRGVTYIDHLKGRGGSHSGDGAGQPDATCNPSPHENHSKLSNVLLKVCLVWERLWEVLGSSSSGGCSKLQAFVMPVWKLPTLAVAKKWT